MSLKIPFESSDLAYQFLETECEKKSYKLEKPTKIQYGILFKVIKNGVSDVIRIYSGKKGATLDLSQVKKQFIKDDILSIFNLSIDESTNVEFVGKVYSLCVGINTFSTTRALKYAEKDAEDLHNFFVDRYGVGQGTLKKLGGECTLKNITNAIEELKRITTKDDTIILYFATHGEFYETARGPDYFLITTDTDINNLHGTALSMEVLRKLISQIPTDKKVLFLDTCHSGGICVRDSKELTQNEKKQVFVKYSSNDFVIIASCLEDEKSLEFDELQHGIFSYSLLSGLSGAVQAENDAIDIYLLYKYINNYVKKYVEKNEQRSQTPRFYGSMKQPIYLPPLVEPKKVIKKITEYMHKPLDNTNVALNFKTLNCIGIDESGKGDYFGPLVVAAVYVKNQEMVEKLISLGVKDSKSLKDDKIQQIAKEIFKICDSEVLWFYPRTYNVRYKVFNNLNKMLAWAHAKSLEKVLIRNPDCDIAVSDQFANKDLLINSLKANGKLIQLIQRPKAEENIAVAAASILARNQFVQRLKEMNKAYKHTFSKGAGPHIIGEGLDFAIKGGKIMDVAKLHFKTTKKIEEKYYEITKKKLMFD